jgi:glycerol-3-phosphate acyltransferase PlsY
MPQNANTLVLLLAAYLIGAIPFGLLIGRAHGVDVRLLGSRNIGATNVGRVVGRKWGYFCLAADILKGLIPTAVGRLLLSPGAAGPDAQIRWLLVALAAVLGHVFPVYLRFRGGKGVATTIGVALGIYPFYTAAMLIALLAYAVVRFGSGLVSLGSLTLAVVFPLSLYACLRFNGLLLADHWPLQAVAILLGVLIIVRHRDNIRRLWQREEMHPQEVSDSD